MSVRSSSSNRLQLASNLFSSNFSTQSILDRCFSFPTVTHIVTAFCATSNLFLIPLYVITLYLGFQRQKRCCFLSSATTNRHLDLLTYNMVTMGLIEVLAVHLYPVGAYTSVVEISEFGFVLFTICWFEKLQFQTLTCIECYVAVVHPVMYLSLKNKTGNRIRTINISWIWLQLLLWAISELFLSEMLTIIMFSFHFVSTFIAVFFCSVSIIWALRRPAPGQANQDREQVHQTKRRAFFAILSIMSAVLLTLALILFCNLIIFSPLLDLKDKCLLIGLAPWFCLPCNTVLPLLYLHRTRKQLRCS